jgi:hypothetical protein
VGERAGRVPVQGQTLRRTGNLTGKSQRRGEGPKGPKLFEFGAQPGGPEGASYDSGLVAQSHTDPGPVHSSRLHGEGRVQGLSGAPGWFRYAMRPWGDHTGYGGLNRLTTFVEGRRGETNCQDEHGNRRAMTSHDAGGGIGNDWRSEPNVSQTVST